MWFYVSDAVRPTDDDTWIPSLPSDAVLGQSPQATVAANVDSLAWPWHVWRAIPQAGDYATRSTPWGVVSERPVLELHEEVAPSSCWGLGSERVPDILNNYATWLANDHFRQDLSQYELPELTESDDNFLYVQVAERVVLSSVPPAKLRDQAGIFTANVAGTLIGLSGHVDHDTAEQLLKPTILACAEHGYLQTLLG